MESREAVAVSLIPDDARLQYDKKDYQRIFDVSQNLAERMVELIEASGDFSKTALEAPSEDAESNMRYARRSLVENWAYAQMALSMMAGVYRIEGDEAFKKLSEFMKTSDKDAVLDFSGL